MKFDKMRLSPPARSVGAAPEPTDPQWVLPGPRSQSFSLRWGIGRAFACAVGLAIGAFLLPDEAQAACELPVNDPPSTFADFECIDEGFRVFTEETFDGNGRTCGTCHRPDTNYNIFPTGIDELSGRERALVFARNVPGLENADLVREFALFNISGGDFDGGRADEPELFGTAGHSGAVFRSSMTVQALDLTSLNQAPAFHGTPLLPAACSDAVESLLPQLGWAGDGAPGTPKPLADVACHTHHGTFDQAADGSIRAFANGAIAQHNPKSLARIEGVDFRFATDAELDAMEAFQKWLGRRSAMDDGAASHEFNIASMTFHNEDVRIGRDHFAGPPEFTPPPGGPPGGPPDLDNPNPDAGAGCNACHRNGGANFAPGAGPAPINANFNLNTHVEEGSDDIGLAVVGVPLPHDEGAFDSFGPPTAPFPSETDEAFNVQSIIEAPRKKAWFHNHRVLDDFEASIAFYGEEDFTSQAVAFTSMETLLNGDEVGDGNGINRVGAFLRALSAYYSLRDCERLLQEAIDRINVGASHVLPTLHCRFNLEDVQHVLDPRQTFGDLYPGLRREARNLRLSLLRSRFRPSIFLLERVLADVRDLKEEIATLQ